MTHTCRFLRRGLIAITLAGLAFAPAPAIAQSTPATASSMTGTRDARAQSSPGVPPDTGLNVQVGETVWLTTIDGLRRRGTVARITREAIELITNGQSTVFLAPQVTRIQVWDSPVEGLVAGGIAGAIFGYLIAGPGCLDDDTCSGTKGALAFGALFAGIGAGIDAITFRRVIFERPGGGSASFTVSPLAARRGLGARAAFEWRRTR